VKSSRYASVLVLNDYEGKRGEGGKGREKKSTCISLIPQKVFLEGKKERNGDRVPMEGSQSVRPSPSSTIEKREKKKKKRKEAEARRDCA